MNNKAYTILTNLTKFCKPRIIFTNLTQFFANLIIFVYAGTVGTATEDREGDDKSLTSGGQIADEE